jgi:hypothetical protein
MKLIKPETAADVETSIAQTLGRRMHGRREATRRGAALIAMMGTLEFLLLGGLAFDPHPWGWILAAQTLPWIGLAFVWVFPRLVSFGADWGDKYGVWAILAIALFLPGNYAYRYAELRSSGIPLALGTGAVLCAASVLVDPQQLERRSRIILVVWLWVASVYSYGLILQLNCWLDYSPPVVAQTKVLRKVRVRRADGPLLRLAPWGGMTEPQTAHVPYRLDALAGPGDTVCVVERAGRLGMPWYTVQTCPWNGLASLGEVGWLVR